MVTGRHKEISLLRGWRAGEHTDYLKSKISSVAWNWDLVGATGHFVHFPCPLPSI